MFKYGISMQLKAYHCLCIKTSLLTAMRHSTHRGCGGGGVSWEILSLASTGHRSETRPTATALPLFLIPFFFSASPITPVLPHAHSHYMA